MRAATRRLGAFVRAVLGPDVASVRQGAVALLLSSGGDLLAGLTLGAITGTLERLPGLLVLVPAAIGMRGNIFGALGSRLGTSIHTGTFRLSARRDTVVGQNVAASVALTLAVSVALAVLAKTIAVAFGVEGTISVADYVVISVLGGALASVVVLVITVGVAAGAARFGWDLDTVAAPVVTAAGDVVTLPSLFLATSLVSVPVVTPVLAVVVTVVAVTVLVRVLRSPLDLLRRIVRESMPVLVLAGAVDVVAGLTIEKRLESFVAFPALLVLIPPFLEDAGALGGILSSRLSSKLHLGVIAPTNVPQRAARRDFLLIVAFAVPVFVLVALSADVAAIAFGLRSPGPARMIAVAMLGGALATAFAIAVAYYGAIGAYRFGLDPDNHGIPLVTSSMDLVGAMSLILAIVLIGLA
ncbi:MAG: mgtE-like transporter [Actinomycetota bacterium]|jgi:mgtE-like transporter